MPPLWCSKKSIRPTSLIIYQKSVPICRERAVSQNVCFEKSSGHSAFFKIHFFIKSEGKNLPPQIPECVQFHQRDVLGWVMLDDATSSWMQRNHSDKNHFFLISANMTDRCLYKLLSSLFVYVCLLLICVHLWVCQARHSRTRNQYTLD